MCSVVGNAAGRIAKIRQAARTAQQNNRDCELLACRVDMLGELLPRLMRQDLEAVRALDGLDAALSEAHDLVMSCQARGRTYKFFAASRMADRFRDVEKKIESYISLIPAISFIGITSRLEPYHRAQSLFQLMLLNIDQCGTPMPLPLDFLKSITGDFSDEHELGRGGFGVVYKGINGNGKGIIAVKKLHDIHPDKDQFYKELISLAECRHENVVQLVGYCDESEDELFKLSEGNYVKAEKQHRLICFEYLSNKSLDNYISDESSGLEWHIRYKIIKGICCGLHYLHKECNIVHLDIKPQNILMDDNMSPKIADFGLPRLFGEQQSRIITENCGGTRGYIAPEYLNHGLISTKSDIFSLGVIIIELLVGSREYPESDEAPFEHFIENVVRRWRNKLEKICKDEHLEIYCLQVKACIEIGMKCVDPDRKKRPAAWDVIEILNATYTSRARRYSNTNICYYRLIKVLVALLVTFLFSVPIGYVTVE